MTPVSFIYKIRIYLFIVLLASSFSAAGQTINDKVEYITLRTGALTFTPKEFYIAGLSDERVNRKTLGYVLHFPSDPGQAAVSRPVSLQGGVLPAIREFMRNSFQQNKQLRPVIISLKECSITEKPGVNGRVDGQIMISMSFAWKRDEDTVHLVDYVGGGASYNRPARQLAAVEQAFRQSLGGALRFFNNWVNTEVAGSERLARSITVSFTNYVRNPDQDTVFYATQRPLTWDDFRDRPRLNRYAASVFPSFAYEGNSQVVKGVVHVNLRLKVYVLKNASWVKDNARDAYGLNHEQRHFDIARLVAEGFKKKVHPDSLNIEDHNSIIQWQYIESFREMNRMQEKYDGETNHGLNQEAQERWNQYIDAELRKIGVK